MQPAATGTGVQALYTQVAPTYERINHVLTLGLDIRWRRRAARAGADLLAQASAYPRPIDSPPRIPRYLDACSGTGEMARDILALAGRRLCACAADFSLPMLARARRRLAPRGVTCTLASIGALPFAAESFDLITIAFALRNLNPDRPGLATNLRELWRVLRPGGHLLNLETSQPPIALVRSLYHRYAALWVRPVGSVLSGSSSGYSYLAHTIPRFYPPEELAEILRAIGFAQVTYRRLALGIAAIHIATK